MASITVDDIQHVYGEQEPALGPAHKDTLKNIAERFAEDVVGGKVARQAEIEGDEDDFAAFVGAHLWVLAEGGEVQSSSQTGGSVAFSHLQGNIEQSLSETRFGRFAQSMIRNQASISIIRADW